jgi:hypothetical protein
VSAPAGHGASMQGMAAPRRRRRRRRRRPPRAAGRPRARARPPRGPRHAPREGGQRQLVASLNATYLYRAAVWRRSNARLAHNAAAECTQQQSATDRSLWRFTHHQFFQHVTCTFCRRIATTALHFSISHRNPILLQLLIKILLVGAGACHGGDCGSRQP